MRRVFRAARSALQLPLQSSLASVRTGLPACVSAFMLVLLPLLFLADSASAQDVRVNAFFGRWAGSGQSESDISSYFKVTQRDLDLEIAAAPGTPGGFVLNWSTIQRQKGDTRSPQSVTKQSSLSFVPTGQPNVWRAGGSDVAAAPVSWARLKRQTLTVNTFALNADGTWEVQVYERTLTGSGMELKFTSFRDGDRARTARALLIRNG